MFLSFLHETPETNTCPETTGEISESMEPPETMDEPEASLL